MSDSLTAVVDGLLRDQRVYREICKPNDVAEGLLRDQRMTMEMCKPDVAFHFQLERALNDYRLHGTTLELQKLVPLMSSGAMHTLLSAEVEMARALGMFHYPVHEEPPVPVAYKFAETEGDAEDQETSTEIVVR